MPKIDLSKANAGRIANNGIYEKMLDEMPTTLLTISDLVRSTIMTVPELDASRENAKPSASYGSDDLL